jgi:hypothetical protein
VIVVPDVPYAALAESAKQHIDAYGTDNPGKVRYGYARWKFGDGELAHGRRAECWDTLIQRAMTSSNEIKRTVSLVGFVTDSPRPSIGLPTRRL